MILKNVKFVKNKLEMYILQFSDFIPNKCRAVFSWFQSEECATLVQNEISLYSWRCHVRIVINFRSNEKWLPEWPRSFHQYIPTNYSTSCAAMSGMTSEILYHHINCSLMLLCNLRTLRGCILNNFFDTLITQSSWCCRNTIPS